MLTYASRVSVCPLAKAQRSLADVEGRALLAEELLKHPGAIIALNAQASGLHGPHIATIASVFVLLH
jgi:hypothetical protein